ncbi:SIR2 family NAD-dependent protein deacylase [Mesorhizobium denitrificans]|uniref:SIR2 family protein n=1 Tax=Mesorhizobium denitrificans TaxID=2294114 RepID=A0A371XDT9_9HYPH|nr:SIR2 family protein [Mesorhizobium denitrificans]RFC67386.1 SIR2 family protein [Mesorhizobium denitrificans]
MGLPTDEYRRYIERQDALIRNTLTELEVQPVFFVGAGMSKRYFSAPSWIDLLKAVADKIGMTNEEFAFLVQNHSGRPIDIGTELEGRAFQWAWDKGKNQFPAKMFDEKGSRDAFFKHLVASYIEGISPNAEEIQKLDLIEEITLLREANPHAIITTNYDGFLEELFEGYEPVIGEQVIRSNLNLIGEIFKIHGSMSDPQTLVITGEDYRDYREKKMYISAKLLTYLAEHPVFIFGYGFGDPNVTEIIQDVGRIIGDDSKFISNIFYVQWDPSASEMKNFQEEYVVGSGDKQYRVRAIIAGEFSWVFKAIAQEREFKPINTKLLRALAARTYKLIRTDIPMRKVEVDYGMLEAVADKADELPRLLGIAPATNTNLTHPFILSQVGQQLGFPGWHGARQLIEKVAKETGVNILENDNNYHCAVKTGHKNVTHKYSKAMADLLLKVVKGEPFDLKL